MFGFVQLTQLLPNFCAFFEPFQQGAKKWQYLSPWAKIEKTKGTLFSSTLKVWENKVSLVFQILAQGLRYSHFLNCKTTPCWCGRQKWRKWLYLSPRAKIEKNKGTLFSQTFKFKENKVPLALSYFNFGSGVLDVCILDVIIFYQNNKYTIFTNRAPLNHKM